MSNQPELQISVKSKRRQSALLSLAQKRVSIVPVVVNLNALVRVFLLDGSSKVLQMFENSTAKDVLIALRFNLDLQDISTHALFRVIGQSVRRIELDEKVSEALKDPTNSGQDVRLLFRTWISYKNGTFDKEVFQDEERHKQANTALWLAFMEGTFMCMTGKYFLTEDESLLLGCLKMQSESGDFNPSVHTLANIKQRVSLRFPHPIGSKMRALSTSTLSGSGLADELAGRVQAVYARIAGKHKIEAQIEYLQCLRTWCPFYGSTFFEVQCQYDDSPLDNDSSPPVVEMSAAVGPLAIFLVTGGESPMIMRHPYKRIIKWIAHPDKHIFTYWVIKPNIKLSDLEQYQDNSRGKEFDPRPYCDCVYLVSAQVRELEYLVKSYVLTLKDIPPVLPGACEELQPVVEPDYEELYHTLLASSTEKGVGLGETTASPNYIKQHAERPERPKTTPSGKVSRLSVFLSALGGSAAGLLDEGAASSFPSGGNGQTSGSGIDTNTDADEVYGDDVAGVNSSLFKNMYSTPSAPGGRKSKKRGNSEDEDAALHKIPPMVQYAASMSELKRVAEESQFSDDEDDDEEEDDESGSEDSDSRRRQKAITDKNKKVSFGTEGSDNTKKQTALSRASRVLFGSFSGGTNGEKSSAKKNQSDDSSDEGAGSDEDSD